MGESKVSKASLIAPTINGDSKKQVANVLYRKSVSVRGTLSSSSVLRSSSLGQLDFPNRSGKNVARPLLGAKLLHEAPRLHVRRSYSASNSDSHVTCKSNFSAETKLEAASQREFPQTRPRIRNRNSTSLTNIYDNYGKDPVESDDELNKLLVSDEEVDKLRETVWKPMGTDVPDSCSVVLGYQSAWMVGKQGCATLETKRRFSYGLKIAVWKFLIMDGTDPESFVSIYKNMNVKHSDVNEAERKTVPYYALRDGNWFYSRGKISFRRPQKPEKLIIFDRLPKLFVDAMIVCIREIEIHRIVSSWRIERARIISNWNQSPSCLQTFPTEKLPESISNNIGDPTAEVKPVPFSITSNACSKQRENDTRRKELGTESSQSKEQKTKFFNKRPLQWLLKFTQFPD